MSEATHFFQIDSVAVADQVTCTDQDTAEVGKEPLITLKEFRSSAALGWQMPKSAVFFGWNIVPKIQGLLRVNDPIQVIKRRTTVVAVPSKIKDAAIPATKLQKQEDILKGAGIAALQGVALAVCVVSILISLMYLLIKSTDSEELLLQPT